MNIQIITAHLEQYRAVRNNAVDALREFISNSDHSLEDRWDLYIKYIELTIDVKELVENIQTNDIDDEVKKVVLESFINDI